MAVIFLCSAFALAGCAGEDASITELADSHLMPDNNEIWQPVPGTSWQWQLAGEVNTSWEVDMYDIDLFDTPASTIARLHADGRIVICYFSAGSHEDWRPDADSFPREVIGARLAGWPGERWLDIRQIDALAPLMEDRLDLAVAKGCDGVEPDNVDGYSNRSGFPLTAADQIVYNRWLAESAHARGLSIGLKNALDLASDLVDYFDWALNEQCFQYGECEALLPFIEAGKAVFGVEYEGDPAEYCPQAVMMGFSWLTKSADLGDEPPGACK
nr:endo alpha-1,4 polygalactosaminidase [Anaerolineae bacterium]